MEFRSSFDSVDTDADKLMIVVLTNNSALPIITVLLSNLLLG